MTEVIAARARRNLRLRIVVRIWREGGSCAFAARHELLSASMAKGGRPAGRFSLSSPSLLWDMCIEELRSRRWAWLLRWWTGDEGEGGSASLQVGSAQL